MDLLTYLKQEPRARERKNKNRALARLIEKNYPLVNLGTINSATELIGEILSLDRKWRKILEENPELRGSDYKDKDRLEEEKLISLGYEPTP